MIENDGIKPMHSVELIQDFGTEIKRFTAHITDEEQDMMNKIIEESPKGTWVNRDLELLDEIGRRLRNER